MKNAKLSLADFKAKADKIETMEALDAVNGGGLFNCHGKCGARGKKWRDGALDATFRLAIGAIQNIELR